FLCSHLCCFLSLIRPPLLSTLFPTRRSSDLLIPRWRLSMGCHPRLPLNSGPLPVGPVPMLVLLPPCRIRCGYYFLAPGTTPKKRSEEHTSELQSRFDLVCRLLLEKKKSRTHV